MSEIPRRSVPTTPSGIFTLVAGAVTALMAVIWIAAIYQIVNDPARGGGGIDNDFAVFWAASKLALGGDWLLPFDLERLNAARDLPPAEAGIEMLWLYPPGYLAAILPLGLMDFFWAWLVFCVSSYGALAWAIWRPAGAVPGGRALVLCAPAAMFCLALGQNSLIFLALLVGVLEAMRRERYVLAGLLLAAMTLKPQLGLAIPVALIAAGYWRVILWATLFTAVLVGLSLIHPGLDYWVLFFQAIHDGGETFRGDDLTRLMVSTFGNARTLGVADGIALNLQIAVSLAVAAGLAWLWSRKEAPFDLKAAGLCLAVLLVTPYAVHYGLVFAAMAVVYAARGGALGHWSGRVVAGLIWLTPYIGFAILPWPGFFFAAGLLLVGFAGIVAAARMTTPVSGGVAEARG